ncbi:unnamed protein product [Prunus brigantina]
MREQERAHFRVPSPRRLLKVVESLPDSTNMRRKVGVNDTWRSRHINIPTDCAMKKGIVDVQPMDGPAVRHDKMQNMTNCCWLDNQTKDTGFCMHHHMVIRDNIWGIHGSRRSIKQGTSMVVGGNCAWERYYFEDEDATTNYSDNVVGDLDSVVVVEVVVRGGNIVA